MESDFVVLINEEPLPEQISANLIRFLFAIDIINFDELDFSIDVLQARLFNKGYHENISN
jgi:hypothetical protein